MSEDDIDELFEVNVEMQPEKPARNRSPSAGFFLDASGHWRKILLDGSWWVVGHRLVYPAKDRDDAERLCEALKAVKW